MFEKLKDVEKRFHELTQKLSDPSILSDQSLYRKIAQEHAHLKALVQTYQLHQKIAADLAAHRQLLREETDI